MSDAQCSAALEKDCAVCLQKCHHPTQLPCGHIFCFLCVKGVAIQSRKCAMCRAAIPPDYLDHPVLLEKLTQSNTYQENGTDEHQWYYEGRNGWWKYDERSNVELEAAWSEGEMECLLLLAGALYCIDFSTMIQTRQSDPTRRRRVRRDAPSLPAKGIAGIKIIDETKTEPEETSNTNEQNQPVAEVITLADDIHVGDQELVNIIHNADQNSAEVIHLADDDSDVVFISEQQEADVIYLADSTDNDTSVDEIEAVVEQINALNFNHNLSDQEDSL
ncbi:E3 ubiquitin-protein ligase rnf146 [Plutella xylostella]|uniref:E3 ubiquitin-protein ligase rnf146 n=1 Tax=Plutella xylostella TaxID=51655 RepID=UPI002032FED5|nr:E3 ubiquitin-protein ligase rnf146 [Plutella xylostella]